MKKGLYTDELGTQVKCATVHYKDGMRDLMGNSNPITSKLYPARFFLFGILGNGSSALRKD